MAKQRIIPIIYKVDYKQVDQSTAAVKKAEQATDKLNKEIKETGDAGQKSFTSLKNAIVATGIITLAGTLAKKIFDIGVAQEQTNIAFNTFLGSATKGKALLQELTKFSIVTPFSPEQVNRAAKSLLAFGVEGNKVIPTLKLLGDVASGTGKDLGEMAIIFGQIRSTGRLMGQDLLQLINAGFNPLQQISEKTGKSMRDLKADMEKGLISFEMVEGAFKDATSAGGLFFNLMEKQSQSIGGKLSTVAGNIEEIFKNIFSASSGPLSEFVDKLGTISEAFLKMSQSAEQAKDEIIANVTAEELAKFDEFAKGYKTKEEALTAYKEELKKTKEFIDAEYSFTVQKLLDLEITLKDRILGNVEAKEREREQLNETRKELGAESEAYANLEVALQDHIKNVDKVTTAEDKLAKKRNKNREEFLRMMGFTTAAEKVRARKDKPERGESGSILDFQFESELSGANAMQDLLLASFIVFQNKKTEAAREGEEQRKQIEQAAFDFGIDAIGSILLAQNDSFAEQDAALQAKYQKELLLAGDNERARGQIELRKAEDEKKLRAKQLDEEKKQSVRRILIETVLNAVKALGLPPIPGANFIKAGQATAYGLLAAGLARRYSKGSEVGIDGAGDHHSDSIPAMLSKGETVMSYEQTETSRGILKAIKAKKLDDRKLEKLYKGKGGDGVAFPKEMRVSNFPKAPDLKKIGSFVYDVKSDNAGNVKFVRSKYIH